MNIYFKATKKDIALFYAVFLGTCALFMVVSVLYAVCFGVPKFVNNNFTYTSSLNVQNKSFKTVIIDAGHGGIDVGGSSSSGIYEKDINLNISNYLCCLLRLSDFDVVMTRSEDKLLNNENQQNRKKYYDLLNRVDIANNTPESIFVSIHQNIFKGAKCSGFQVYYSKNNKDSASLAKCMQNSVVKLLQPDNKRTVKPSGTEIFVLHRISRPAVLAECGFLSNQDEAKLLNTSEYQKKLALVILDGILNYISSEN